MPAINYLAVLIAAVAAFVASSIYYMIFGKALMAVLPDAVATDMRKVPAWKKAVEFVRGFIVAFVLAVFVGQFGIVDWIGALRLAFLVWIGFPFMILVGAVLWDNRPWKFAAIHSGDWLMKLVLMAVIFGIWRR